MGSGVEGGLAAVAAQVAGAVGLQEGQAGVRRILSVIRRLAPAPTRDISRHAGIPVPLVTAVAGELRARGVLTADRPPQLTAHGTALLGAELDLPTWCACCNGSGLVVPQALEPAAERLAALLARAPQVDVTLDQSYSTVPTKLRRIALLLGLDLLPAESVLFIGDDDLMSLSLLAAGEVLGRPLAGRLAVVDVSAPLLELIEEAGEAGEAGDVEVYEHDLRDPLPERLRSQFEVAVTDPPYTVDGARLFLSRAAEGLLPGPGLPIVFSFGQKGPADTLAVQRAVAEIGLATQATYRNFNEYEGSGVLGGTSHLHWLVTTETTSSVVPGRFPGPLYTAQARGGRTREYTCLACGATTAVGPGVRWASIGALKAAGCPGCGAHRFRPLRLVPS